MRSRLRLAASLGPLAAVLALTSVACARADSAQSGSVETSITSAGSTRSYRLYRPAAPRSTAVPLVIVLHGAGGGGGGVEKVTGFDALADSRGFVVAYPDARKNGLWEWGCCAANPERVATDDNQFVADLIDHLVATEHVDPNRVYVAGMSVGGTFAQRLACQLADKITAIASVGGTQQLDRPCAPSRPVSVIQIKGRQPDDWYDGSCPVNGVCTPFTKGYTPSAPQLDEQWRTLDHCPDPHLLDLSPVVHVSVATACAAGTTVVLVSIDAARDGNGTHGHHCWTGSAGCPGPPDATSYLWNQFAGLHAASGGSPATVGGGAAASSTSTSVPVSTTTPGTAGSAAGEPSADNNTSNAPIAILLGGLGVAALGAALFGWRMRQRSAPRP